MRLEVKTGEKPLTGKVLEEAVAAVNAQGGDDLTAMTEWLKNLEGPVYLTSTGLIKPAKGIVSIRKRTLVEKP